MVEPEPYPLDAVPNNIRGAVEEVRGFVKVPVPLMASSAVFARTLACQAHIDGKRAERVTGPVSLLLLTIAGSGERKTTCDGVFAAAVGQYQEEKAEAMKRERDRHMANLDTWTSLPGTKRHAHNLILVRRLLPGDETPENLAWNLARQWPSAGLIFESHGTGKEGSMRSRRRPLKCIIRHLCR
jgi:putative DNA primase/helicase